MVYLLERAIIVITLRRFADRKISIEGAKIGNVELSLSKKVVNCSPIFNLMLLQRKNALVSINSIVLKVPLASDPKLRC